MHQESGGGRVAITFSIAPEFQLKLGFVFVNEKPPIPSDFVDRKVEIGYAQFTLFSEIGEITTYALLWVECDTDPNGTLVVEPRPALAALAEPMRALVVDAAGETITAQSRIARKVYEESCGS